MRIDAMEDLNSQLLDIAYWWKLSVGSLSECQKLAVLIGEVVDICPLNNWL